jgi:AcrR family transcriptional regulator
MTDPHRRPGAPAADEPAQPRRRDAARTRRLLLEAARRRFALAGYAATTLREIAEDAGVNVALIGRYFESKEGLFTACLTAADDDFRRDAGEVPRSRVPEVIAGQIAGPQEQTSQVLLLLLRPTGDERADRIRLEVLRGYAERLAGAVGWRPGQDDGLVLRAQLALAATTGIMLLRKSGLQPLAAAGEADLVGPIRAVLDALLLPPAR